jgi:hypothetical protein
MGSGRMKYEIHRAHVTIARPIGHDPGTVEQSCYIVEGGNLVVLTDSDGNPLVRATTTLRRRGDPPALLRWERLINPGEDHGRAARQLLWTKYNASKKGRDFNRPISMKGWGTVA